MPSPIRLTNLLPVPKSVIATFYLINLNANTVAAITTHYDALRHGAAPQDSVNEPIFLRASRVAVYTRYMKKLGDVLRAKQEWSFDLS